MLYLILYYLYMYLKTYCTLKYICYNITYVCFVAASSSEELLLIAAN